jgi:hypothetical protein
METETGVCCHKPWNVRSHEEKDKAKKVSPFEPSEEHGLLTP